MLLTTAIVSFPADVRAAEPDLPWQNGVNRAWGAPLKMGPLTWTMLIDSYYGYAFNRPADHTVFPTTTAPRHNEFNLNLAALGLEVTEQDGLFGRLLFQAGNYVDTITGADGTTQRGAYQSLASLRYVQQAYAGQRFPVLQGLNVIAGLFPAYIGLDSYIPQENWNYTHNLCSDFTPYYLSGVMAQLFLNDNLKGECWLVNGWQSLGKHGEGFGLGYSVNYRPNERLSLTHNVLTGAFDPDGMRQRIYVDNTLQWQYWPQPLGRFSYAAIAAVVDCGYETAGVQTTLAPATWMGGAALLHRLALDRHWAITLRGSAYADPQRRVALTPPSGQPIADGLIAAEGTITLDYQPSAWMLYRLEYRRDQSNVPYIAGPGGLTGQVPDFRTSGDRLVLNSTVRF